MRWFDNTHNFCLAANHIAAYTTASVGHGCDSSQPPRPSCITVKPSASSRRTTARKTPSRRSLVNDHSKTRRETPRHEPGDKLASSGGRGAKEASRPDIGSAACGSHRPTAGQGRLRVCGRTVVGGWTVCALQWRQRVEVNATAPGTTAPAFRLQPRAGPPEHGPSGELAMLQPCRQLGDRAVGEAPVDVLTSEESAQVASASARTVSARQACTLAAAARGGGWPGLRAEADAARASRRARRGLHTPRGDERGERRADRRASTRRSCGSWRLGSSARRSNAGRLLGRAGGSASALTPQRAAPVLVRPLRSACLARQGHRRGEPPYVRCMHAHAKFGITPFAYLPGQPGTKCS